MNIPETPHFAIITFSTHYTPGDERSRTNPGHGYPASWDTVTNYQPFTDQAQFERECEALAKRQEKFHALKVTPLKVETKTTVTIK